MLTLPHFLFGRLGGCLLCASYFLFLGPVETPFCIGCVNFLRKQQSINQFRKQELQVKNHVAIAALKSEVVSVNELSPMLLTDR